MPAIGQLVSAISGYQVGAAAVERIHDAHALTVEPIGASPVAAAAGVDGASGVALPAASVTFRDVRFGFGEGSPRVHDGVSFHVPAGGMTAFVGPSGAGKTTVFALIERFYDAAAGQVLLDDRDVRDWPVDLLRAQIGYVEQDAPVLSGTLRENLLFGAPDASAQELTGVLATARLTGLVGQLPDGLDARVRHRGITLSGGESSTVTMARRIVVMDAGQVRGVRGAA